MGMIDALAMEYQYETGVTRKVIERVPEDKYGWKPHDKSMTAGALAAHIVEIQGWTPDTLAHDEFKIDNYEAYKPKSKADLLQTFDTLVADTLKAMKGGVTDQLLMKPWKMTQKGQTLLEMPKVAVIRTWVLNHQVHHRGQLSVYLRLLGQPVPSIYGPSADEQG